MKNRTKKAYLNWSSGKDAAFALFELQKGREYSVEKLLTTINSETDRISMHGLRKELLLLQAKKIGLPVEILELDGNVSMETYNAEVGKTIEKLKNEGFSHSIFGDIFLKDLREYRDEQLVKAGITGVFPLWKRDTGELIEEFLNSGFKAITVCVNSKVLDKSFCGRIVDHKFISDLPEDVDPCGENGEFHTFVYDGPIFSDPVKFKIGEIVEKFYTSALNKDDNCFRREPKAWDTAFWYCDLKI